MKKMFLALAAVFALATPAVAAPINDAFTGPRVEVAASTGDRTDKVSLNSAVGVDLALGDRLTVGAEGTVAAPFKDSRVFGIDGRLGLALNPRLLLFGTAGYEDRDGFRYGGGAEYALTRFTYVKAQYRRTEERRDTGLIGLGLRF